MKPTTHQPRQVIFTNQAACRDCYRCVRVCPSDAVRIENGQATVVGIRCISCGMCVVECPQKAKAFTNRLDEITDRLHKGESLALSLAPSFPGYFESWEIRRLAAAAREAGFSYVAETAVGAWQAARAAGRFAEANPGKPLISGACPAAVNLIEKYFPNLTHNIIPIASPAQVHARQIKSKNKNTKVVFAGPCIAKKDEVARNGQARGADYAITFSELRELFKLNHVDLANCEESGFDELPPQAARYYPLSGGFFKTAGDVSGWPNYLHETVSGYEALKQKLAFLDKNETPVLLEPFFCEGGCLNGPDGCSTKNYFSRRKKLIDYALQSPFGPDAELLDDDFLKVTFNAIEVPKFIEPSEEDIQKVLTNTGKAELDKQLNCGACGYDSCRLNAIAVINGLAEPQMCMPYMRRLAEEKNDLLIRTSPNGILVVNEALEIVTVNPAFKQMFTCGDTVVGRHVSYLIDPDPFEKLKLTDGKLIKQRVEYPSYNLICHQLHYAIKEEGYYAAIFIDVTNLEQSRKKVDDLKEKTLEQAKEMLGHQLEVAAQMAKLLGENTAKGEALLTNLIRIVEGSR